MLQTFHINLSRIFKKDELFEVFSQTFGFPSYFGKNWDALEEVISDMNFAYITGENITHIHLVLDGYKQFKFNFDTSEREILETILTDISSHQNESKKTTLFTFEMK